MVPEDSIALRLRFREREGSPEPPDLDAFRRSTPPPVAAFERRSDPRTAEPLARPRSEREVGVLASGGRLGPSAPFVMFFRHTAYGIPALGTDPSEALGDLESWSLRPTVFGWLASVPAPRRGPSRSRAAWIVAACLPLVLPAEALAAPRREPAPVQVPAPPGAGSEASTEPEGGTEATPGTDPEASPDTTPPEGVPIDPTTDLPPVPPPSPTPALEAGSEVDQATVDAAWEGVDGFDVELELKGHRVMQGRIGAVQRDTFTLIQAKTGAVLVLPKSGVLSLRVRTPPPLPTKTGTGALVGGGILTAVGTPVFITGLTFIGICPSCASIHLPMLLVGGAALGAGIPLLVRGGRARRAYQEAMQERALAPVVLRTPHGWTGGLRFRF
jgi:hypothetical protein